MLTTVISKEIRDLISSTTFAIIFGVCALLILLSFYIGAANYKQAVSHYEASTAENLRQMEGLTDWFSLEQHRIFLPPQPLEALVTGVSNDIGRTIEVKTRGELVAEDSRFNEDPFYAVFQFLDLNFVFQIVLSLFAILLGYNAVSGEKEGGTLRLVFANAIPRATFILGKLVGSFIALSLSILVAIGLGCVLLPVLGVFLTGDEWLRLTVIVLGGMLYFGAFLTLSVFVSATTQRASSSFVILLVVWIGLVLIIPRASVLLAGRAVDVPTVDELAAQKATFARGLWKEFRDGLNSFESPELEDPNDIEALMAGFNQYMDSLSTIRDAKMDEFAGRLNEDRSNRQKVQERVAFNIARISPSAALSLATGSLAGTSIGLKNRFYDESQNYRRSFNSFMKEKTGMNVGGRMIRIGEDDDGQPPPEPIDATEIPAFQFQSANFGDAVASSAVDLGILTIFNLVFFAGAFIGFLRYDLR